MFFTTLAQWSAGIILWLTWPVIYNQGLSPVFETGLSLKNPVFLALIFIGILPILLGISMWLQQKLNPAPADPVQAKVMQIMPIMFTAFFAFFPSGLVLYWVTNTLLSIAQQWKINTVVEREAKASKH